MEIIWTVISDVAIVSCTSINTYYTHCKIKDNGNIRAKCLGTTENREL